LMVGGLYGASIGHAFFGESMFHIEPEMDKVALWHCHQFLVQNSYQLWDTQYYTEHLGRFGCIEIGHKDYMELLKVAIL
jgi:leucyl/phenylalanyl-tRNA--protein transferase